MRIIALFFLITVSFTTVAQTYSTLPYQNGFESGLLDDSWRTINNNQDGRVQVNAQNEAWLYLDLSSETEVTLKFDWKEFNDEADGLDGVFFFDNNGIAFVLVS